MKKTLSLCMTGLITLGGSAIATDKVPVRVQQNEILESAMQPLDARLTTPMLLQQPGIRHQLNQPVKQLQNRSLKEVARKTPIQKSMTADLPNGVVGEKIYQAYEYFDKQDITWEGSISVDATTPNKIWVSDLFFKGELDTPVEFYGLVDATGKKVSFPCGQILASTSQGQDVVLCGVDDAGILGSGKSITGSIATDGTISFTDYVGANVGEANNGWYTILTDLVILDKATMKPSALYETPQGMLYQGWTSNGNSFYSNYAISPAFVDNTFQNISSTPQANFEWTIKQVTGYDASQNDILETTTSTAANIVLSGEPKSYRMPTLKASLNGKTAEFTRSLPADTKYNSYIQLSGSAYIKYESVGGEMVATTTSGLTLADPANEVAYYRIGDPDINGATPYMYGTGISANGKQRSLINRYQKPLSTLYFEGVEFFAGAFSAPAQTPFTCSIIRIEDNGDFYTRLDTIATSTIYTENVISLGSTAANLQFKGFTVITDLGLPAEVEYLELDDPFIVELTGFSAPNVVLALFSEENSASWSKNKSYFTLEGNTKQYQYNQPRVMMASLFKASYPYMVTEDSNPAIQLDDQGSNVSMKFFPFYNGIWIENDYDMPEWLSVSVDEEMNQTDYSFSIHISAEPRPANVAGRQFNLEVRSFGAKTVVPITQGVVTGISDVASQTVKAVMVADQIELTYQNMQTVTLTDVNGKVYATYPLAASGKTLIPAATLAKGVYMLKFAGASTEVVKFIK